MARRRTRLFAALLVPLVIAGCKGDSWGITEPAEPGISFRAGAAVTDTVDAQLVQALIVEVRGEGGRPAPGMIVRFTAVPIATSYYTTYRVRVSGLDAPSFTSLVIDTTDARGRASVLVSFGKTTGPASVVVTVPELGFSETATYTVAPGSAERVVAAPKDTLLFAGGSVTLRSTVTDRYGNPRPDPVTVTRVSGGIAVQGNVVTAQTDGLAKVISTASGISDTTHIAVVPSGAVIAASAPGSGVVTMNLDGSNYRVVTSLPSAWVRWAPDGSELTFDNDYAVPARVVTMAGAVRPVRASSPSTQAEMYPVYSPDKEWVYLSVIASSEFRLWRVRPDGTGAEPLNTTSPEDDFYPSPSPDGTRLAYVRRTGGGEDYMRILDLNTGAVAKIDVPGHAPAWSPLGDLIAYVDLRAGSVLKVMRPDGTGQRQVSPTGNYEKSVQWSPDGKWLIAYGGIPARIQLIDVATGSATALTFAMLLRSPTWRP